MRKDEKEIRETHQRHIGLEGHGPPERLFVERIQQVVAIQVTPSFYGFGQETHRVLVLLKVAQEGRFSTPNVSLDKHRKWLTASSSVLGSRAKVHCLGERSSCNGGGQGGIKRTIAVVYPEILRKEKGDDAARGENVVK